MTELRINTRNRRLKRSLLVFLFFFVFNATLSNISATGISWRPVLVVEEAGVPGENSRP